MQSEEPIEHSLETRKLHEFLTNGWHGGRLDKDEAALSAQLSALANFMIKRHKCRAPMLNRSSAETGVVKKRATRPAWVFRQRSRSTSMPRLTLDGTGSLVGGA